MPVEVKCPEVPPPPYPWGKIRQRVGQLRTGPSRLPQFCSGARYFAIPEGKKVAYIFPKQLIYKHRVMMGDETLHPELSPNSDLLL